MPEHVLEACLGITDTIAAFPSVSRPRRPPSLLYDWALQAFHWRVSGTLSGEHNASERPAREAAHSDAMSRPARSAAARERAGEGWGGAEWCGSLTRRGVAQRGPALPSLPLRSWHCSRAQTNAGRNSFQNG